MGSKDKYSIAVPFMPVMSEHLNDKLWGYIQCDVSPFLYVRFIGQNDWYIET